MDVMKTFPDGYFDLAIVDPPYGIRVGDNKQGMVRRYRAGFDTYDPLENCQYETPP